jgi:hypothetical protein
VSPARAKTQHNGRPICGYRRSRNESVLLIVRLARGRKDRISLARRAPSRSPVPTRRPMPSRGFRLSRTKDAPKNQQV